jgi:peptidoglycan/xylan/chitin deacetylase (PgdA/CDA1 family)
MGAYPASVSTFTVVGRLWVDEGDGADGDADPDVNPQEGVSVTFTPQLNPKRIRVPGFGLVDIEPVAAVTDADGYVKTLNGEAVVLAYGGDPDITPTGWTWLVSIEATSVVPEDEFSIAGSAGGTVDLSEFASVSPADPGAEVVAWVSARDAAIAAKDDAEAAQAAAETAQAAAEAAQAAAEAVPTSNDAIVAALLEDGGSATRVAANAAFAGARQLPVQLGGDRFRRITFVVYHAVNLTAFNTDLDYYQEWNYTTVTPDQVLAHLNGTGTLPAKPLLITFDDGYNSQHAAAQALNTRGMVGTFYIATGWIDGTITGPSFGATDTVATWTQIQQWKAWGHDIQSHTVNHLDLESLTPTQVAAEFTGSKARIEAQVSGQTVRHLAYPYGSWDDDVMAALSGAGCETARVVKIGSDGHDAGPGLGTYAIATTQMNRMAFPSAGADFGPLFQVNCGRKVVEDEELVPDYGFEAGGKGWSFGAGGSVVTSEHATGTRAAQILQQASTVSSSITRIIPVGPYAAFSGKVKIKTAGLPAGTQTKIQLQTIRADGSTIITTSDAVVVTGNNGAWTEYTINFVADAGCAYLKVYLWLQGNASPTGAAYFDDLSVKRQLLA